MIIYFLRHAEAEVRAASDFERKLTAKGKDQSRSVGKFCCEHELIPDLILTSPVCRARETAVLVNQEFSDQRELIEVPWAACGMSPESAFKELRTYDAFNSLMLVGHEPDLSTLIATTLGLDNSQALSISKASLTIIQFKKIMPGHGILEGLLPCSFTH
ncbi:MAG: phosphohistidine phosphatase SixA [Verrucomicrobia bacterium RIFCSPHIGHO2_12_FULL_41_10]|nr:MAG: phosphohistidine phosphatase SixA [Verrucomicrobia bacterium RIFCSPHIGHO2_12_FULL_41_10]HLB33180.1 phosphohistidine phosphatase SixA [Chthoniobacterales bacterium]